jgi:hypothetical protein
MVLLSRDTVEDVERFRTFLSKTNPDAAKRSQSEHSPGERSDIREQADAGPWIFAALIRATMTVGAVMSATKSTKDKTPSLLAAVALLTDLPAPAACTRAGRHHRRAA